MSTPLTEDQLRRMEENRKRAMAKRAEKMNPSNPPNRVQSTNTTLGQAKTPCNNNIMPSSKPSDTRLHDVKNTVDAGKNRLGTFATHPAKNNQSSLCNDIQVAFSLHAKTQPNDNVSVSSASSARLNNMTALMEENRKKALAKRAEKLNQSNPTSRVPTLQPVAPPVQGSLINSSKENVSDNGSVQENGRMASIIEENRKKALAKRAEKPNQSNSSNRVPTLQPVAPPVQGSLINSSKENVSDNGSVQINGRAASIIEENRKKALAKRAEKLNQSNPSNRVPSTNNVSDRVDPILYNEAVDVSAQHGRSMYVANRGNVISSNSGQPAVKIENNISKGLAGTGQSVKTFQNKGLVQGSLEFKGQRLIAQNTISKASTAAHQGAPKPVTTAAIFGQKNVKGVCTLISRERFQVDIGYSAPLIEFFKTTTTGKYDTKTKLWDFSLNEYTKLNSGIAHLKPAVEVEPLPKVVLRTFQSQIKAHLSLAVERKIPEADLSHIGEKLVSSLRPFQRTGINFGIWKAGRVMIADDMGLGKTIQAIGIAAYYRDEWPLLIVVPSSVRFAWAEQLRTWLPLLDPQEINVIVSGRDNLCSGLVNILSYDIMARKGTELLAKKFRVIIFDESHFLKNFKTARCTSALPLTKAASRVILLSGTPALSRPNELFTQVQAVHPGLFSFKDFGVRYCAGKRGQFGWDFNGSSNMTELQIVLQENVLIRRLKKDVLSQLPDKIRQVIVLDPQSVKIDKTLKNGVMMLKSDNQKLKGVAKHSFLLENFSYTANAKSRAVRDYILDLLESDRKLLVFGHHQAMLNAIQDMAEEKKYKFIRIDGSTPSETRNHMCTRFQNDADTRLAILSITAANAGLHLTAANLVVFAELYWTPGVLMQAEDRAHRIGQKDSVTVHYLIAQGTADDVLWSMVKDKLTVLGGAGLYKEDFSEASTTCLKNQDSNQRDITSYFQTPTDVNDVTAAMFDDDDFLQDIDCDLAIKTEVEQGDDTDQFEEMGSEAEMMFLPPLKKSKV